MKCPHCTTSIHERWTSNDITQLNDGGSYLVSSDWRLEVMTCPECKNDVLRLGRGRWNSGIFSVPKTWTQVYPQGSSRGAVPPDVPLDIAKDYREAALILPLSAKASAALSRRCLQSMLRGAGYAQHDLSKQIEAVLGETDARKALPTGVYSIVDAVRHFGNFSAHKITDKTTLEVIDVEPHEAEYCLDILDALFDHYYVKPAQAQRIKDELNKKLAAAARKDTVK